MTMETPIESQYRNQSIDGKPPWILRIFPRRHVHVEVIYTASTLVEQSTPVEHLIFDATATVAGNLPVFQSEQWKVTEKYRGFSH